MPGSDTLSSLEGRRARIEQQRENSARLARAYCSVETTGWGEVIKQEVLDFGIAFIHEPYFTSGVILRGDSSGPTGQLVEGRYPRVSCGVWRWQHDENGHWTGAYMYFVIETVGLQTVSGSLPSTADPGYTLAHHMVFEAVAYKNFPLELLDES